MTRVLIAADESETSIRAAKVAHSLFGDLADYMVVNVADPLPDRSMAWGYAYPVMMPMVAYPAPIAGADPSDTTGEARDMAHDRAASVAAAASLGATAQPLADVGDPATAILDAAHQHQVDVIVVGSHDRNWFARLLSGSVSADVLRETDIPVLVVK